MFENKVKTQYCGLRVKHLTQNLHTIQNDTYIFRTIIWLCTFQIPNIPLYLLGPLSLYFQVKANGTVLVHTQNAYSNWSMNE